MGPLESKQITAGVAGLCATCGHAKAVASSKGSVFLLCVLSKTDPRFPKYPPLPVVSCTGYQLRVPDGLAEPPRKS